MTTLDNSIQLKVTAFRRNASSEDNTYVNDRSDSARILDTRDARDAQRRDKKRANDHSREIHAKFERALDRVLQDSQRSEGQDKSSALNADGGAGALNRLAEQSPLMAQSLTLKGADDLSEDAENSQSKLQCDSVDGAQGVPTQPAGFVDRDVTPPPPTPLSPQDPSATMAKLKLNALDLPHEEGNWRFEVVNAALPISEMQMQRTASGGLQVELKSQGSSAGADIEKPVQRLRERLAERGVTLLPMKRRGARHGEPGDESDVS